MLFHRKKDRVLRGVDKGVDIDACNCKIPTPDAFIKLAAHSKLSFETWYKALWYIQHRDADRHGNVARMCEYLGVSYATANSMRQKIRALLDDLS